MGEFFNKEDFYEPASLLQHMKIQHLGFFLVVISDLGDCELFQEHFHLITGFFEGVVLLLQHVSSVLLLLLTLVVLLLLLNPDKFLLSFGEAWYLTSYRSPAVHSAEVLARLVVCCQRNEHRGSYGIPFPSSAVLS